ncbi:PiggyBac transposable element-derived protein 3 [Frankliniella fusca]|uniref:PiggyBac transposable element-derived protein 3 n=1 Tax=Frankliniella fusca TaxID=407009 RepID=A0AAE1I2S1_9NEOP|nr:PiggyBac transposable element-derived protein 3 [Frankliniella fusca]
MIAQETNLYTTQKSGKSICVIADEIMSFFGIMIYMGVCSLPAARASENLSDQEKQLGVGAIAVIALSKSIKNPKRTTVTFDIYDTGIPLITYLRNRTIKRNRTQQCPLTDGKKYLQEGRGTFESRVNKNAIVVVQWADKKPVCLASSFVAVELAGTMKRYSKEAHGKIDVPCPRAVAVYNQTMGGVDLSDMYMTMYKIPTRAKRYYFPFIGYCFELALTNRWLQYRRDSQLLEMKKKDIIPDSKKFRLLVREELRTLLLRCHGHTVQPSLDKPLTKKKIKRPMVCRPNDSLRTDGYGHLPEHCDKGRCRYCTKGTSRVKCSKCQAVLCLNLDRNCFAHFHITEKRRLVPEDKQEEELDTSDED